MTPDTWLAWHRALIAPKYNGHKRRVWEDQRSPRGFASGASAWRRRTALGATPGIQAALGNFDHHGSRGTIANLLKQDGIEPLLGQRRTICRGDWQRVVSLSPQQPNGKSPHQVAGAGRAQDVGRCRPDRVTREEDDRGRAARPTGL